MEGSDYFFQTENFLNFQLFRHVQHEILRPAGRGDHAVGQGLFQFGFCCTCFLRAREVFFQSGGAADRHGATDPDKFPGARVQDLFILEIEKLLADLHGFLLSLQVFKQSTTGGFQMEYVSAAKAPLSLLDIEGC
jgi:hypothetical protein